jgi:hypothetical protein
MFMLLTESLGDPKAQVGLTQHNPPAYLTGTLLLNQ